MRSFVFTVVSSLMVATALFSQKAVVPSSLNDLSRTDEQQIRQLESEILTGEMNSDPAVFEKILADDYLILNNRMHSGPTKTKLVEGVRKAHGQAPSYTPREEDMQVYMLGDTAIAMYVKEYAVRANPSQVDREDVSDVFVRSGGTWKAENIKGKLAPKDRKLSHSPPTSPKSWRTGAPRSCWLERGAK